MTKTANILKIFQVSRAQLAAPVDAIEIALVVETSEDGIDDVLIYFDSPALSQKSPLLRATMVEVRCRYVLSPSWPRKLVPIRQPAGPVGGAPESQKPGSRAPSILANLLQSELSSFGSAQKLSL